MMKDYFKIKDVPEIRRIVLAAFPSYRKHHVSVRVFGGKLSVNSYWDGGSRDEHCAVSLETWRTMPVGGGHPFFDVARHGLANQASEHYETDRVGNIYLTALPPNVAIVTAGTFCGKPATACVTLHPDNVAKLLPQSM